MKKTGKRVMLFLVLGLFLFPNRVFAGFGISPSGIYNEHLKPGASFEQDFIISRSDPDEDLVAVVEPELEEIEDWFSFKPGKRFTMPKGEQRVKFTAVVKVPENAPYGQYKGVIRIKATPDREEAGGVSVIKGARMEVELLTTDLDVTDLLIRNIKINQVKSKDELIKLLIKAENTGNTDTAPSKVSLNILNLNEELLETLETSDLEKIKPDETKEITAEFKTELGNGDYFVDAKVFLNENLLREERLVLEISGRGEKETEARRESKIITNIKESAKKLKSLVFSLPYFLAGLLLVVLVLWLVKKIKQAKKQEKKKYLLILVSLGIAILFIGGLVLAFKLGRQNVSKETKNQQDDPKDSVKGIIFEAVPETEDKGEDVSKDKPVGELEVKKMRPMIVRDSSEPRYRIYREPDLESQIVFVALEDQSFTVIEEKSEWYRVELPNGADGWLPKASVKQDK